MYIDKQRAIQKMWRVPESNLYFFCACGGFLGIYMGILIFRHKIRHLPFYVAVIASGIFWLISLTAY